MGLGFRRGSYKCLCRKGFYFPDVASLHKFFNGSLLEEEYEKLMLVRSTQLLSYKLPLSCSLAQLVAVIGDTETE